MPSGIIAALLCAITAVVVCPQSASAAEQLDAERFDIVIKSGRIVDGSGSPWYRGDRSEERRGGKAGRSRWSPPH